MMQQQSQPDSVDIISVNSLDLTTPFRNVYRILSLEVCLKVTILTSYGYKR